MPSDPSPQAVARRVKVYNDCACTDSGMCWGHELVVRAIAAAYRRCARVAKRTAKLARLHERPMDAGVAECIAHEILTLNRRPRERRKK